MPAFKLDTFGGMIPASDETILPQASSVHSENTWLYPGKLAGMRTFDLIKTLTAGTAKVFRLPNTLVDSEHIADSVWMEFQNPHTDVVRSLVIGDTFDRYFWASSSAQPMYNTRARIAATSNAFKLGIPAPGAPSITV